MGTNYGSSGWWSTGKHCVFGDDHSEILLRRPKLEVSKTTFVDSLKGYQGRKGGCVSCVCGRQCASHTKRNAEKKSCRRCYSFSPEPPPLHYRIAPEFAKREMFSKKQLLMWNRVSYLLTTREAKLLPFRDVVMQLSLGKLSCVEAFLHS